GKASCYGSSWRDLRRRCNAGIACWTKLEITPPSLSNHSRYGTNGGSPQVSYTVTGNNQDTTLSQTISVIGVNGTLLFVTATCTPAPPPSTSSSGVPTDSQNLRSLQLEVTKTVAAASGAAITSAVGGAINDAFSATGGTPVTVGPNGVAFNFAAEPQRDPRLAEISNVFAYGGNVYKAPPRAPLYLPEWSAWADIRGTGFDRDDLSGDLHGHQINITGGIGRKLTPDILVGLVTGYENFNFTDSSIAGKMTGDGGTIGSYAAWRFGPHWRLDGMFGWSDIFYNATAGAAAGSFTGSRWLSSGGFTGNYAFGSAILEPSANVYALWEHEGAWTDTLGTLQDARSFSVGRVSLGDKVSYPWWAGNVRIAPYLGLYGDWRFSTDNALPVAVPYVGIKDGWSARATAGVTMLPGTSGVTISLGGELGGLGAGYDLWSVNGRVSWPF
ncbi:MAG: autotransporter outer membrane beta-barrel domain-containing protein, partial [Xanthobacteraceae bacterium]